MAKGHILLSLTWSELDSFQKSLVRRRYKLQRRMGSSINDARYYCNYLIDVLRGDPFK